MHELISKLVSQADLSQEQAQKAAEVIRGYLLERLPEALRGPVDGVLNGQNVDSAFDQAKHLLGDLFK